MQSEFAVNKYLHTVASGWICFNIEKSGYYVILLFAIHWRDTWSY